MAKIFLIALMVRVLFSGIRILQPDIFLLDEKEYYYNGKNLDVIYNPSSEVPSRTYDYEHWYNRTPVYMLFRFVTQDFTLIVQMILSSLGVVLMWKMNKAAGWLWCFYLPEVFYSFHYLKASLMTFAIILTIYLWKNYEARNKAKY